MKNILLPYLAAFLFFSAFPHASTASINKELLRASSGGAAFPGVEEKLGQMVPGDVTLYDETGMEATLGSLIDRPTVLIPAYYRCTNICADVSAAIARIIGEIDMAPGVDYSIITLSFDETDTPRMALRKKTDYVNASGLEFPSEGWRFLTGHSANIRRVTSAVGYSFQRDGPAFRHPATLVVLSPTGKIIRYLYGDRLLPFDLKMALVEASAERPGASIPKALLFCYTYDPEKGGYAFSFIKLAGLAVLLVATAFFIAMSLAGRPKDGKGRP